MMPGAGRWNSSISLHLTNTLNVENSQSESLNIDGEIYSVNQQFEYGLSDNWSFGTELGWLRHQSGFMDRAIERYHELLNLPQGDRLNVQRNQFNYTYESDNAGNFDLQEPADGIGDVQLYTARRLITSRQRNYNVKLSVKLPTGDPDKLTGSGATDYALWINGSELLTETWQLFGSSGLLWLGNGEVLARKQEERVLFGNIGVQWQCWPRLALKAQAEWSTGFYNETDIRFLKETVQLTAGGSWQVSSGLELDIALTEDIKAGTSPDVTFHFGLRYRH